MELSVGLLGICILILIAVWDLNNQNKFCDMLKVLYNNCDGDEGAQKMVLIITSMVMGMNRKLVDYKKKEDKLKLKKQKKIIMGLDQYGYARPPRKRNSEDDIQIMEWRKHNRLQ